MPKKHHAPDPTYTPPEERTKGRRIARLDGRDILLPDVAMKGAEFARAVQKAANVQQSSLFVVVAGWAGIRQVRDFDTIPASMPSPGSLAVASPLTIYTLHVDAE